MGKHLEQALPSVYTLQCLTGKVDNNNNKNTRPMEEVMDSAAPGDKEHNLESLPTELLAYIVWFLPSIREKAKLRYVLRSVGETSSLWNKFVWPQFDSREEQCVKSLLDMCTSRENNLFPDGVRLSVLLKPLSKCCKLIHLSMPSAELVGLEPDQFRNTLHHMQQLEKLEVYWKSSINPLLLARPPRLKELTVHSIDVDWLGTGLGDQQICTTKSEHHH